MPILTVRHVTTYRYRQPVSFGEHRMMMRPRDSWDQRLLEAQLRITPEPVSLRWMHDVFGNCVAIARFSGRATELRVASLIRLDHTPRNALDFQIEERAQTYPFSYSAEDMPDLLRSIERQYSDPNHELERWVRQFLRKDGATSTRELLSTITHTIRREFVYIARPAMGTQEPLQTLRIGSGTCRDFAVLMMEAVRALGLAARYASGYVYSPGSESRRRIGGGATHAWVQVYVPGAGWMEMDPTNGIVGNRDLIRVAVVRDPSQAVPLSGNWTGFPSDHLGMDVEVEVTSDEEPAAAEAPMGGQYGTGG